MIEYLSWHSDLTRALATSIIAATPLNSHDDSFDIDRDTFDNTFDDDFAATPLNSDDDSFDIDCHF